MKTFVTKFEHNGAQFTAVVQAEDETAASILGAYACGSQAPDFKVVNTLNERDQEHLAGFSFVSCEEAAEDAELPADEKRITGDASLLKDLKDLFGDDMLILEL